MSELKLDVDQAGEIKAAFRRERGSNGSEWTNEKIKALTERKGLLGGVLDVLDGRAAIVSLSEPIPDTIIHVDRCSLSFYPDWVDPDWFDSSEFIKLETGPIEYDLATINLWLHDEQKNGKYMEGHKLYEYLKEQKMLKMCLSISDGEKIRKKGIAIFRKFFGGKSVFLWKSVARDRSGHLRVPYLYASGDEVMVGWHPLDYVWHINNPALRFAS